ncbi:MAG: glycosyltransferase family 2 protein [Planctomycetes bacterium]|nr:glycosyltransferase family 2 protein [Planctomycetota bacterium]
MRFLTAIPVYNEDKHLDEVLAAARRWAPEILVVDDGSTDGTPRLLGRYPDVQVLTHPSNEGYGAALRDAFRFAVGHGYDALVTMDCDGQHQPERIPDLVAAIADADIVSGSRYLKHFEGDSAPPQDRRRINQTVTQEINRRLGLNLTDAFCGFKAYRTDALRKLDITEPGYAMPLEMWVQAARLGFRIKEVPVPLIYLEEHRAFGGALDDATRRLAHYREVIERAVQREEIRGRL